MVLLYVTPIAQAASRGTDAEPPLPGLTTPQLTLPQYVPPKADPTADQPAADAPISEPKPEAPKPAEDRQPSPQQAPQQQAPPATQAPAAAQSAPAPVERDSYVVHRQAKQQDSSTSQDSAPAVDDESSPMAPTSTSTNIDSHRQKAIDPLASASPAPAVKPSADLQLLEQAAAATPTPAPTVAAVAPPVATVAADTPAVASAAAVPAAKATSKAKTTESSASGEQAAAPASESGGGSGAAASESSAAAPASADTAPATAAPAETATAPDASGDGGSGQPAPAAPAPAASGSGSEAAASGPAAAASGGAASGADGGAAAAAPAPAASGDGGSDAAPVKAPEPAKISPAPVATISAPVPATISAPAPVYIAAPAPVVYYAPPPPPPVIVIPPVAPALMVVGANTINSAVSRAVPSSDIATSVAGDSTVGIPALDVDVDLPQITTADPVAQDAPVADQAPPATAGLGQTTATIAPTSTPQITAGKSASAAAAQIIATDDPPVITSTLTSKAFDANAARGPPTIDDFNRLLAGFGQVLTVLQTLKSYASLASSLPLIGDSVGNITHFIDSLQQSDDALSAYLTAHTAPRVDEVVNLLLGQFANKSVTPTVDEHQIALAISQSATHSQSMPLTLGTQGTNLGVSLNGNATVTGSLGIDFTIGVKLDDGIADADRFFVKITKLQLGGVVAVDSLNASATLGPLDTAISAGTIALSATATISVNNSADGVLTVAELQAATPASLFGTPTLASTLSANLPLDIQLNGVPLPGGALKLDSADLFAGQVNLSFAGLTYTRELVDGPGFDNAQATELALTLTQPIAFDGFTLQSGTVSVAMIQAGAAKYFGATVKNLTGGLAFGTLAGAHLTGVNIGINFATGASALNWADVHRRRGRARPCSTRAPAR